MACDGVEELTDYRFDADCSNPAGLLAFDAGAAIDAGDHRAGIVWMAEFVKKVFGRST